MSVTYGHVFFVKSLLVTSAIIIQMLKYLFSSVPCNTKFVKKRKACDFCEHDIEKKQK